MRKHFVAVLAVVLPILAIALYFVAYGSFPIQLPQADHSGAASSNSKIALTVLDRSAAQGVLGKEVRSAADENIGRIVDIIVDSVGHVRAVVVDVGGFLGVGIRKIAVSWSALHFAPVGTGSERITLELMRNQLGAAPEYKEDQPITVLSTAGNFEWLSE
jgi:hypothetical protein